MTPNTTNATTGSPARPPVGIISCAFQKDNDMTLDSGALARQHIMARFEVSPSLAGTIATLAMLGGAV